MKSSNIIKGNLVGIPISDGFEVLDKSVDPSGEGVVCNSAGWLPSFNQIKCKILSETLSSTFFGL